MPEPAIVQLRDNNHQEIIEKAIDVLSNGGIIIYPTETCYGIGVDATNQDAVSRLLEYKSKRKDKPLSVAVATQEMAEEYVELNDTARHIYKNFLPGPVTVVSRGRGGLADGVESSTGTQGIRIPAFPFLLDLVETFGKPITSTSANASYKKTPYSVDDIFNNISEKQRGLIGLIIDAGQLPKRKSSTVVDTRLDSLHIVRDGAIQLANAKNVDVQSLEETHSFIDGVLDELGKAVGTSNIVFLLQGELGTGKTHIAKHIGKHLGVTQVVNSPTFTLCNEYRASARDVQLTFYHIDTYRMYEPNEIDLLRPTELFQKPNIVVIEWANKVHDYIQQYMKDSVVVTMLLESKGENERTIEYTMKGL